MASEVPPDCVELVLEVVVASLVVLRVDGTVVLVDVKMDVVGSIGLVVLGTVAADEDAGGPAVEVVDVSGQSHSALKPSWISGQSKENRESSLHQ